MNASSIDVSVRASDNQINDMTARCELSEQLMARTLSAALKAHPEDSHYELIVDWFKAVRMSGQAALMTSGIQYSVSRMDSEATTDQAVVVARLTDLVATCVQAPVPPTHAVISEHIEAILEAGGGQYTPKPLTA